MKIVFMRHGLAKAPVDRYPNHDTMLLSERGIDQAKESVKSLVDIDFDTAYVSPLARTQHTFKLFQEWKQVNFFLCPELEERCFKSLYGRRFADIEADLGSVFSSRLQGLNADLLDLEGEETLVQCKERISKFLNDLRKKNHKKVLIVGHGGPHEWLICSLLGVENRNRFVSLGEARFSLFEIQDSSGIGADRIHALNIDGESLVKLI
jgi:broad specificity phosphatase PhoE